MKGGQLGAFEELVLLTVHGLGDEAYGMATQEMLERETGLEDYAEEVLSRPNPLDATAQRYQGGGFVTQDFTPTERRPSR